MWVETHRCAVEGCPNLAAYEVLRYDFDLAEGAVVLAPDESCPAICVEHAIDNERHAQGERRPGSAVRYPYTNQLGAAGFTIYRQLESHYADELSN
jgi:hypothetical protein